MTHTHQLGDASLSHSHTGANRHQASTWPAPTDQQPSLEELEEYMEDSICPATDGCEVEPDGMCEHGHPSWMLRLGFI